MAASIPSFKPVPSSSSSLSPSSSSSSTPSSSSSSASSVALSVLTSSVHDMMPAVPKQHINAFMLMQTADLLKEKTTENSKFNPDEFSIEGISPDSLLLTPKEKQVFYEMFSDWSLDTGFLFIDLWALDIRKRFQNLSTTFPPVSQDISTFIKTFNSSFLFVERCICHFNFRNEPEILKQALRIIQATTTGTRSILAKCLQDITLKYKKSGPSKIIQFKKDKDAIDQRLNLIDKLSKHPKAHDILTGELRQFSWNERIEKKEPSITIDHLIQYVNIFQYAIKDAMEATIKEMAKSEAKNFEATLTKLTKLRKKQNFKNYASLQKTLTIWSDTIINTEVSNIDTNRLQSTRKVINYLSDEHRMSQILLTMITNVKSVLELQFAFLKFPYYITQVNFYMRMQLNYHYLFINHTSNYKETVPLKDLFKSILLPVAQEIREKFNAKCKISLIPREKDVGMALVSSRSYITQSKPYIEQIQHFEKMIHDARKEVLKLLQKDLEKENDPQKFDEIISAYKDACMEEGMDLCRWMMMNRDMEAFAQGVQLSGDGRAHIVPGEIVDLFELEGVEEIVEEILSKRSKEIDEVKVKSPVPASAPILKPQPPLVKKKNLSEEEFTILRNEKLERVIKRLEQRGFQCQFGKGSHMKFTLSNGGMVVVPRDNQLKQGTAHSIEQQVAEAERKRDRDEKER